VPVAVLACALAAAANTTTGTTTAAAAANDLTAWKQAAAKVTYPVYAPAATAGLRLDSVKIYPCQVIGGTTQVVGSYRGGSGSDAPTFFLAETSPNICGNAGEAKQVATIVLKGHKVQVLVFFSNTCTNDCTVNNGVANGYLLYLVPPVTSRTKIQFQARHMTLAQVVQVLRSLQVVSG
jgi:hypothetical protein